MPVALIARANLEFARQYLSDGWRVFAASWAGQGPNRRLVTRLRAAH